MKFRIKIALCMIGLLSLLFGVGGSALMAISFQNALDREQAAARKSFEMLLTTLRVLGGLNQWTDVGDVSETIGALDSQGERTWTALRLTSGEKVLYEQNGRRLSFSETDAVVDTEHFSLYPVTASDDHRYLQLSGLLTLGNETLTLSTAYDISSAYVMRSQQRSAYVRVFWVMVVLCALLSYSAAWLLTRPLGKLSRASRELAAGNLDFRLDLHTSDEIGALSQDFDAMAGKVQHSMEMMQDTMAQQEMFMGSFAHELKTPMTSIIGYADLLRGQTLSQEEAAEAANYIFSEGRRLESLSIKLLNLLMADKQDIHLSALSPADIARDVAGQLKPVYEKQGIELVCHCEQGQVLLDGDGFQVLLLNLLDNARKAFDGPGRIIIFLKLTPEGCLLKIRDNGRGIPEEALKHLTEAFYRVDKARSRQQGGVGLGLSLCRKIVEVHGGSMSFESLVDMGTCVTVELKGGRP